MGPLGLDGSPHVALLLVTHVRLLQLLLETGTLCLHLMLPVSGLLILELITACVEEFIAVHLVLAGGVRGRTSIDLWKVMRPTV